CVDGAREDVPVAVFLLAQPLSFCRELVHPPAAAIHLRPAAGNQAGLFETMQGGIERAFRQVDQRPATAAKGLGDRIAVPRRIGDRGQEEQVEMTLQRLRVHALRSYTSLCDVSRMAQIAV